MNTYITKPRPNQVLDYVALLNEMDDQGYELADSMPQFLDNIKQGGEHTFYLIFRRRKITPR